MCMLHRAKLIFDFIQQCFLFRDLETILHLFILYYIYKIMDL